MCWVTPIQDFALEDDDCHHMRLTPRVADGQERIMSASLLERETSTTQLFYCGLCHGFDTGCDETICHGLDCD